MFGMYKKIKKSDLNKMSQDEIIDEMSGNKNLINQMENFDGLDPTTHHFKETLKEENRDLDKELGRR